MILYLENSRHLGGHA